MVPRIRTCEDGDALAKIKLNEERTMNAKQILEDMVGENEYGCQVLDLGGIPNGVDIAAAEIVGHVVLVETKVIDDVMTAILFFDVRPCEINEGVATDPLIVMNVFSTFKTVVDKTEINNIRIGKTLGVDYPAPVDTEDTDEH